MSSFLTHVASSTGGLTRRRLTVALAIAFLAACADLPATGPATPESDRAVAGTLVLHLSGIQPQDAAFQVELMGIRSTADLTVAPPLQLQVRQRGEAFHAAVFGTPANGALLRVQVPDVRDATRYTVRVTDVARQDGALRASDALGTYRASFMRTP